MVRRRGQNASIVFVNSTNVMDSMQYAIENKTNGLQIPILSISYGSCEPSWTSADLNSMDGRFNGERARTDSTLPPPEITEQPSCDDQQPRTG